MLARDSDGARRAGVSRRWLASLCLGAWLGVAGGAQPGWAQEAILRDRTVPEAAERFPGVLERAFEAPLRREGLFPRVREFLETGPPFLRDTELRVHFRTYYLDRDDPSGSENEAWAAGRWLQYRSGWLLDTLQLGATLYTSQPLYAPKTRGTGARDPATGQGLPNDRELDLAVDYRIAEKGWLGGCGFASGARSWSREETPSGRSV